MRQMQRVLTAAQNRPNGIGVDSCRLKAELVLARLVARSDKLRMKMPAQRGELWVGSGINWRFLHRS
jgi:hypothetical protein